MILTPGSFLKYNSLSLLWALAILIACLLPGKDLPRINILDFDKAIHFGIYLILVVLMNYGWKKQTALIFLHNRSIMKILLISASYGFVVEVLQELLTADRHFDLYDVLANFSGAVAGSLLTRFLRFDRRSVSD